MKINTKVRYGLRTMIELGCHNNKTGVHQREIAKNQQLSEKYLDPIISSLKAAGLIINISGKKSGYIITKPPKQITVLDVFKAFEADVAVVQCLCSPSICERADHCATREYWSGLNDVINGYFKGTKLSTLINRYKVLNKPLPAPIMPSLFMNKIKSKKYQKSRII
jgi:Rrf2 family protein